VATKTAVVKQLQGVTFFGRTDSNHWVAMDGPKEFGGSDAGTRPKELVLVALGGCTASDVAAILKKKRAPVDNVEVRLTAEVADEHPQVFTRIHVEYVFYGTGIKADDVERAIELSETKYCSVSAMLRPAVILTHSYRIEPSAATPRATGLPG
jgi:putative redox protein